MINWLKSHILSVIIIGVLVYILFELKRIEEIVIKTEAETELNNFKLDFVEADINKSQLDTTKCCDKK
jgi:hypothetical protein